MRYTIIAIAILVALIYYLNRSYASIYSFLDTHHLSSPDKEGNFVIINDDTKGALNYVVLGDSLSSGVGTDNYFQSFPYLFAQKLSATTGKLNLINLSKPGARTSDVLKIQLPKVLSLNPDYISLLIGINDIHGLISETDFDQNFGQIIDNLVTSTHSQIYVLNIPFLGSEKLIHQPYRILFDWRTRQFNSFISSYCNFKRIHCIDLYSATKLIFSKQSDFYSRDQFHPSEAGYLMWSQLIYAN